MRSSSIGSPLLSTIRKGDYLFSSTAYRRHLTLPEIAALSVLSPRGWSEVMTQACAFDATVSAFPLSAIQAVFLVRTTFLISDGSTHGRKLTEFSRLLASQLFEIERALSRNLANKRRVPVLAVSTLPATMQRDRMRKRGPSSGGLVVDLSLA